jgi:hypothetical protein
MRDVSRSTVSCRRRSSKERAPRARDGSWRQSLGKPRPLREGATARSARLFPRRAANRRSKAAPSGPCGRTAPWARGVQPARQTGVPLRVLPARCRPALALCPGAPPAPAASRAAVPKRALSIPSAALILSAPRCCMPGLGSRSSPARVNVQGGGGAAGGGTALGLGGRGTGDAAA